MVRLTALPCNSLEAQGLAEDGQGVKRAERVPNAALANHRIESRTHHDF
jgi:hypothetical protein